jgi:glutaredoxin-related protein
MKTFALLVVASLSTPASAFLPSTSSCGVVAANGRSMTDSRLSMASSTDDVITSNPVIKLAANGMSLLKPIFALEAYLQAAVLGAITKVDKEAVIADIEAMKSANDVLIYTYGLSPFSTEALSILDKSGTEYAKIELGLEWFLLGGEGSETRMALSRMVVGGATSLPKVFIGGECIGGCAELAAIAENGELAERLEGLRAKGKGGGKDKSGNFLLNLFA